MFDENNDNLNTNATKFDLQQLAALCDGEKLTAESGNWSVYHYGKKGILFLSDVLVTQKGIAGLDFKNILDVSRYLQGEKVQARPIIL